MEAMTCRACGAKLDANRLDRRLAIISCDHCGAIFDLTRSGGLSEQTAPVPEGLRMPSKERAPTPMPDGFTVDRSPGRFEVRWRWFKASGLFMVAFAVIWDVFVIGFFLDMWDGDMPGGGIGWGARLFPLIHVSVGIFMTYKGLANVINSTRVVADEGGSLTIRHWPLPWLPMPTLRASEIEQLYCEEKRKSTKNGEKITYGLFAVTREDVAKKLLGGLEDMDQVLYLEQEIERTLGIRDRPIAGELDV